MRLCPWSLALASSIPVLGLERFCPRKGCPWPWPWPRNFFVFLALALASSLVSSTPPLTFTYIKFFSKKYCSGLVEGLDLIFEIISQSSGQENILQSPKIILAFSDQKVLFGAKGYCQKFVSTRVLFVTAILTIVLLRENSTNSLKVENRTNQSCKILIDSV